MWEYFLQERSKVKRFRELAEEEKQAGIQGAFPPTPVWPGNMSHKPTMFGATMCRSSPDPLPSSPASSPVFFLLLFPDMCTVSGFVNSSLAVCFSWLLPFVVLLLCTCRICSQCAFSSFRLFLLAVDFLASYCSLCRTFMFLPPLLWPVVFDFSWHCVALLFCPLCFDYRLHACLQLVNLLWHFVYLGFLLLSPSSDIHSPVPLHLVHLFGLQPASSCEPLQDCILRSTSSSFLRSTSSMNPPSRNHSHIT